MSHLHHTVRMRLNNIRAIREWIDGKTDKELKEIAYQKALLRKIQLQLGVTKRKAMEYLELVLDDTLAL